MPDAFPADVPQPYVGLRSLLSARRRFPRAGGSGRPAIPVSPHPMRNHA